MSRALYHLSYGTARRMLARSLRPSLQLALLRPVLRDGYPLSLVHCLTACTVGRVGLGSDWLRSLDSNQGPSGYEPDELPLLHSAIKSIPSASEPWPRATATRRAPARGTC